jgi:hypothetical protein
MFYKYIGVPASGGRIKILDAQNLSVCHQEPCN